MRTRIDIQAMQYLLTVLDDWEGMVIGNNDDSLVVYAQDLIVQQGVEVRAAVTDGCTLASAMQVDG